MRLTPKEEEKLMLHLAGNLAKERRSRGLKLNYAEAVAYLSSELLELARDGRSVTELMEKGRGILNADDVMDGVADMVEAVQVEATFPDGTKLVTVHNPIGPGISKRTDRKSGEVRESKSVTVANIGDRPIQVGSHFHFFEVNKLLKFDRDEAFGFRLDIPSGTSVRFEPGEEKKVQLVELGGKKLVYGCNDLTRGKAERRK